MFEGQTMVLPNLNEPTRVRLEQQRKARRDYFKATDVPLQPFGHGSTSGYYVLVGPVIRAHENIRKGFGGYLGDGEINEGSAVRLRTNLASEFLPRGYNRGATGYYCDEFQQETMVPIVARLPRSRGFLAGWTMGKGMATNFEMDIYDTAEEAAQAAHGVAEYAAAEEQRYQATRCSECDNKKDEYDENDLCTECRAKRDEDDDTDEDDTDTDEEN
jgi:hypothetical protein